LHIVDIFTHAGIQQATTELFERKPHTTKKEKNETKKKEKAKDSVTTTTLKGIQKGTCEIKPSSLHVRKCTFQCLCISSNDFST
jgi:hypothetical protein